MELTSSKKIETNKYELEVKVGAEEFAPAVDRAFKKRAPKLNVPGFRRGKAPRSIVMKMFGEGMFYEDAVNELYPKAYEDAVEAAKLEPVAYPEIEITAVDKDGFTFKAVVINKPEVKISGYKGIKAPKTVKTVSDDEVADELERQRKRGARILTVEDRAAKEGDTVVIDFEGFVDGVAFEGGKGENYSLKLGSGQFIPGFEDQVAGHSVNEEFDVNVTFPEEYQEDLKGKDATFKVKLHEIKEEQLPQLDDEFAKDVSEFDTLEELKKDTKEKLQKAADERAQEEFEDKVIDQVVEQLEGEIPDEMVAARMDDMMREYEYRLKSQGIPMEMYLQYMGQTSETFRESFRDGALRRVKISLALEKIAELEKIEPNAEEIEAEYQKLAEQYKKEADEIKKMIGEKDIIHDVAVTKAIDLIRDSAIPVEEAEAADEKPQKKAAKKASKDDEGEAPKKTTRKKTAKKADEENA
ncbi:trigger factor [Harryflintia acetispora]|uniref:Trigger factor n=1 Tax=Harryflintia acetispora TaxID=1849041 RepID=A0A9X8Y763_9FIRM|nr:trigger factor [Harryflintia acetispora]TCL41106.1 trigger factor [Harryflintia acetispora]